MKFEIKVDIKKVQRLLKKTYQKTSDLREPFRQIAEIIHESIQYNFDVGGRYSRPGSWRGGSEKWKPLALSTILERERLGYGGEKPILVRTRDLRYSITDKITKDSLVIGTNLEYAKVHQLGNPVPSPRHPFPLPARPFLVVQEEDLEDIAEILENYLIS